MATADQINARLANLYAVRDSGVALTRHGDTIAQFRSMEEVLTAIRALEGELATAMNTCKGRVSYVVQSTKGYGR